MLICARGRLTPYLVLVEIGEVFAPEPVMTNQPLLLGPCYLGLLHLKCLQRPEKSGRGHGVI
jgi:hypothetical protein